MYKKQGFFADSSHGPKNMQEVCVSTVAYKSGSHSEQTRILKNVNVHRHFSYLVNGHQLLQPLIHSLYTNVYISTLKYLPLDHGHLRRYSHS